MRSAALVLVLVSLAGCGIDRLSGSASELRASPQRLVWDRAWVGHSSSRTVTLENSGRFDRTVRLSSSGPFSVEAERVEVAAGGTVLVAVAVTPSSAGTFEGSLTIESESVVLKVPLRAEALVPPECEAAAPCHSVAFDPDSGACVDTVLPDDTACSAPCLDEGTCHSGECLGASPTCDDGDACTQDGCDPVAGCVHLDASDACVAPAVECKVAFCDPVTGCGVTDAVDGTSCGPADCITADVCLSGLCKTVPVPEGATCAPSSPCQSAGTCHQQQCVVPPATTLEPVWSYTAAPSSNLVFTGTLDAQSNLYWLECESDLCDLVSFDPAGNERFRKPLRNPVFVGSLARGAVVVVGASVLAVSNDTVQSFRTSDGLEEWFSDLRPNLLAGESQSARLQVGPIVDLGQGRIAVRAVRMNADPEVEPVYSSWVVALSTTQGHIDWTWKLQGFSDGLIAQADGSTWFFDYPVISGAQQPRLVSLTRYGALRVSQPPPQGRPLAMYRDRVVAFAGALVSSIDGSRVSDLWVAGDYYNSLDPMTPLLGDDVAYLVGNDWGRDISDVVLPGAFVRRFDPANGDELWSVRIDQLGTPSPEYATQTSQPALLANQSVLVARGDSAGRNPWQLFEITKDGAPAWVCDLPGTDQYGSATVIRNERLFTGSVFYGIVAAQTVCAFDVPGLSLAPKGWTVLGGNPEAGGRPR